jgi:murein DD-endopeptidase MepM/ murein hydrolase activator NlpD
MLDAQQMADLHAIISDAYLDRDIADEMLDHYASHIEALMIGGKKYSAALETAIQSLPEKTLTDINKAYKRTKLMKNIKSATPIAVGLTLFAIVLNIQLLSQEETYQLPLEKDNIVRMSSGFGMRRNPIGMGGKIHTGMDFIAQEGTPVKSVKSGVVKTAKELTRGYGHHIVIQHADSTQTLYAHLKKLHVQPNDTIRKGEVIGTVGNTGASVTPHLHFEIINKGKKVNPISMDSVFKLED